MFGVIVANVALVYDALRIAVCPGIIFGVVVVSIQLEGVLSNT
jgi:hypothetical protein